jgi:hypothetical protein
MIISFLVRQIALNKCDLDIGFLGTDLIDNLLNIALRTGY